jgi:tetratricopeptide (TPR) repeat protein
VSKSGNIAARLDALDSHTDLFGPDHPSTLAVVRELGVALWCAGDIDGAVDLLEQLLDRATSCLGGEHPLRVEVLTTLGEIVFEQRRLERAGAIHREVLEQRVRQAGANHPLALAAKADLAAVLFELGQDEEANSLEREAFESARIHLGKSHSVTSVLAWNRALGYEGRGDLDSARKILSEELTWLLAEDPSGLETDQNIVRGMVAERLNWDRAAAC